MNKNILLILLMVFLLSCSVESATYYFNSTGNDSQTCTSINAPCRTTGRMLNLSVTAPSSILFQCGNNEIHRLYIEGLTDLGGTFGGSAGNYVTYSSYGTCNSTNLPQFRTSFVANKSSDWINRSNNIWELNWSENRMIAELYYNAETNNPIIIKRVRNMTNLTLSGDGHFYANWTTQTTSNDNSTWVYSSLGNPYTVYGDIEVVLAHAVFYPWVASDSWAIFENMSFKYVGTLGINILTASNIIVRNLQISYVGGGPSTTYPAFGILGNAIQTWNGAENISVYNNTINQVTDAGLTMQGTSIHANLSNIEYFNNIVTNAGYGLELFYSGRMRNISVHHNTFFNTTSGIFQSQRAGTDETLQQRCVRIGDIPRMFNFNFTNNICYESRQLIYGSSTGNPGLNVTANYSFNFNYNWRNISSGILNQSYRINSGSTDYVNLSAWQTGQLQDLNSVENSSNPFSLLSTLIPFANGPVCSMSSTGGYVGALPCTYSRIAINNISALNDNITINNFNISFNISGTSPDICLFYVNNVLTDSKSVSAGGLFNFSKLNLDFGSYNYYISCNDSSNFNVLSNTYNVNYVFSGLLIKQNNEVDLPVVVKMEEDLLFDFMSDIKFFKIGVPFDVDNEPFSFAFSGKDHVLMGFKLWALILISGIIFHFVFLKKY